MPAHRQEARFDPQGQGPGLAGGRLLERVVESARRSGEERIGAFTAEERAAAETGRGAVRAALLVQPVHAARLEHLGEAGGGETLLFLPGLAEQEAPPPPRRRPLGL